MKGNGVRHDIETEHTYEWRLKKSSRPGHRHHFTDGSLEGEIGGWGMVTEDEFAQSGPALINGRNCSVIPEMFAMMAMKKKIAAR